MKYETKKEKYLGEVRREEKTLKRRGYWNKNKKNVDRDKRDIKRYRELEQVWQIALHRRTQKKNNVKM